MTIPAPGDPKATPNSWLRSNWLAEKIVSGELPAPTSDTLRQCDEFFVAKGGLDAHVELMASFFAGDVGAARVQGIEKLRAYLERLLLVREMWAQERC